MFSHKASSLSIYNEKCWRLDAAKLEGELLDGKIRLIRAKHEIVVKVLKAS